MILNKVYSEPEWLFETVEFKKKWINIIFARKDEQGDSKKSLNGVWKSLLLNLIDYALLSSKTPHIKSFEENNDIANHKLVLDFSINDELYRIKRSFETPNEWIIFWSEWNINVYDSTTLLKTVLCDLIFEKKDYKGSYSNKWLRKMLPFYIKKQESKKNAPALKWVQNLVQETYWVKDIAGAQSKIDKLRIQVEQETENIENFKLAEQYKNIEEDSNDLTVKIKELIFTNHKERNKIRAYESSYLLDDQVQTTKIKRMYVDLNELLAKNIKKSLDDAIKFRQKISKSRKDFLAAEIDSIKDSINIRNKKVDELEIKRAELYEFLSSKKAIKDLSEAYLELNKKTEQLKNLESQIRTFNDLTIQVAKDKEEAQQIYTKIVLASIEIKNDLKWFKSVFFELHNSMYPENKDEDFWLEFEVNEKKDSKVDIDVLLPQDLSYWKNRAKTLLYDLSVLLNSIKNSCNGPKFIIHDWIFDWIDKAHFVTLYEYLKEIEPNMPDN